MKKYDEAISNDVLSALRTVRKRKGHLEIAMQCPEICLRAQLFLIDNVYPNNFRKQSRKTLFRTCYTNGTSIPNLFNINNEISLKALQKLDGVVLRLGRFFLREPVLDRGNLIGSQP